ncbi:MAG TPA: DUF202 domain-containing protein [Ohtaekwangia sp.]|nr:DUF202 domain-containing protein [Ohtaekwangia sp.]
MNKDLILREYLAIERTKMANQRTLLTYIRTGLYFLIAGSTLGQFIDTSFWRIMDIPLISTGVLLMIVGAIVYRINQIKIEKSIQQIGKIKDDFIKDLKLDDF